MIAQFDFPNGWTIDLEEITDGQAWLQRWPPGVQRQSIFANLSRMPLAEFESAIESALRGKSAQPKGGQ